MIELAPEISFGYENVGSVYFSQGKFKEAITNAEKALTITPNPDLYDNIGEAYSSGFILSTPLRATVNLCRSWELTSSPRQPPLIYLH